MTAPVVRRERGSALIMSIMLMIVIAAIVASITISSLRSSDRSNDARRRVANDATVQTAITRVLYALQNDLGSEQDYYVLDQQDLTDIITGTPAQVIPAAQVPTQFRQTAGVWEHVDAGQHQLRRLPVALPGIAVQEAVPVDPAACASAGLPAAACAAGDVRNYWQLYRVITPDITGNSPPNVVAYLRSWIGSPSTATYSKASYARAELRPGRFADYQQISDGNVRIGSQASINGPVHSNGFADGSFSTVQSVDPALVGNSPRWIYAEPGVSCVGEASLSITQGVIRAPGTCRSVGATGQTISFLRAIDSIRAIRDADAAYTGVRVFNQGSRTGNQGTTEPYGTAWTVRINGSTMSVSYPDGSGAGTIGLQRVNAFVFDDDVRVRGTASPDVRLTIAAERAGGASANIFIDGNITKGNDRTSSIGLIAQGDVVLWMEGTGTCPVSVVQAAMVAATGGITIPTRYTTSELQEAAPSCGGGIRIDGAVAGHRPPTLVWGWTTTSGSTYTAGYDSNRQYQWDKELKRNPPPFFPLTGTWQAYEVREGNVDCLFDNAGLVDPDCR